MPQAETTTEVGSRMLDFAGSTGISNREVPSRRYLWTDAHAVCNFLTLFKLTGDELYQNLATDLVDQVHQTLGRFREDDDRTGWISGLDDNEGQKHPTAGGLRIGKELNERGPHDAFDERTEWDRDGQYLHYLTKWMHALCRTASITGEPRYIQWAAELARAAHAGFSARSPAGGKRLYWKMSIDLSYPLVPSSGLHDPLDCFITYHEIDLSMQRFPDNSAQFDLSTQISETAEMCRAVNWETSDPLGIGGLLFDACRIVQMQGQGVEDFITVSPQVLLAAAKNGIISFIHSAALQGSAEHRLAFRELGLSIGLHALEKMHSVITHNPDLHKGGLMQDIESLMKIVPLSETIENFWRAPANQNARSWQDHFDINCVMLATSLAPGAFLSVE